MKLRSTRFLQSGSGSFAPLNKYPEKNQKSALIDREIRSGIMKIWEARETLGVEPEKKWKIKEKVGTMTPKLKKLPL